MTRGSERFPCATTLNDLHTLNEITVFIDLYFYSILDYKKFINNYFPRKISLKFVIYISKSTV